MNNQNDRFRIYRNLTKGCFSVLKYSKDKKGFRLHEHVDEFVAIDVSFKINESGRQRVIRDKQKNVHAFAECSKYLKNIGLNGIDKLKEISYNPYIKAQFYDKQSGGSLSKVDTLIGHNGKIYTK
jgi:hypothetical protein